MAGLGHQKSGFGRSRPAQECSFGRILRNPSSQAKETATSAHLFRTQVTDAREKSDFHH